MAINIHILNGNNIVTLNSPGKSPIKTSSGMFFYNANMLLCAAVGACAGKAIVGFCLIQKIDVSKLQRISVDMLDNIITIYVQHDPTLDMEPLRMILETCEVSKKLSIPIEVKFLENDKEYTPVERSDTESCCGR